jgi:hypothetical protein
VNKDFHESCIVYPLSLDERLIFTSNELHALTPHNFYEQRRRLVTERLTLLWPLVKARFLALGYTIRQEFLVKTIVDAKPYYKDERDPTGRVVRQELACHDGARAEAEYHSSHEHREARCIQEPRIVICWDEAKKEEALLLTKDEN